MLTIIFFQKVSTYKCPNLTNHIIPNSNNTFFIMIAIIFFRYTSNSNSPKCQEANFPEMTANIIIRHARDYNSPEIPAFIFCEMLANINPESASNSIFRNASSYSLPKYSISSLVFWKGSNYNFRKCKQIELSQLPAVISETYHQL